MHIVWGGLWLFEGGSGLDCVCGGTHGGRANCSCLSCLVPAAFSQGHLLRVSESAPDAVLTIPYPESDNWFLSLQLLCPKDVA